MISSAFPHAEKRRILRTGIARARVGSFAHHYLGQNSALTYWYEGRFDLQLRAMQRLIRHFEDLGKSQPLAGFHYSAGTALVAMERYDAAERHLRAAFRDCSSLGVLARAAVVECRLYRDDHEGALQVLDEVAQKLDAAEVALTRAYIQALGTEVPQVPKVLLRKLLAPAAGGRDDYMAAVVLLRLGRADVAVPRLRRFIERCEGNPSEWGVTMRWEIAKAKELLVR